MAKSEPVGRVESGKRQLRLPFVALAAAATVCLAGHWEFEQVDSGSLGGYVAIDKMSDGTIWLAYVNRDSAIRLAHKDTAWEYENLDTALVRPDFRSWPSFSFDIGPGEAIGVVGLGRLAEFRDSGWSSEQLPMPMRDMAFSYDSAGRPSLTFKDSLWNGCLGVKTDSGWDTSLVFIPPEYTMWFSLTRPCWRRGGNCALIEADVWSMGGLIDGYDVSFKRRDSGVWTDFGGTGGLDGGGYGFAALADSSDSIHTLWSAYDPYGQDKLVCDAFTLDSYTSAAAACLDDSGRVQCAWLSSPLKFAIPGRETWVIPDTGHLVWCDITTDTLAEPVVAFCRRDGAIWVAQGVGIVGLSDERNQAAGISRPEASVVRGVLILPQASSLEPQATSWLLDINGRKVMELHCGANDVGRLAPGVYFVLTPSLTSSPSEAERDKARGRSASGVERDALSITKAIIAR